MAFAVLSCVQKGKKQWVEVVPTKPTIPHEHRHRVSSKRQQPRKIASVTATLGIGHQRAV